jgi:hypothetical protein
MSLDISKLENVRTHGGKITARCPACAEAGHDQTRNHLIIGADGRFGCVVYPGASPDAREHRKRIFALCGNREIKPLIMQSSRLGRFGRPNGSHSSSEPLKTGLLGRLGRLFQTHSGTEVTHAGNKDRMTEKLNDFKGGVPGVLSDQTATPRRPLSERERALLMRWCGTDDDAIVLEARSLFKGTIVGIERSERKNACMIKACQTIRSSGASPRHPPL